MSCENAVCNVSDLFLTLTLSVRRDQRRAVVSFSQMDYVIVCTAPPVHNIVSFVDRVRAPIIMSGNATITSLHLCLYSSRLPACTKVYIGEGGMRPMTSKNSFQ